MLEQGFLDEVSRLRAQYPDLSLDLPSMRCVGYRQAWEHQDGLYDRREFIERGIAATRQLAKRQLTWTRGLDVMPVDAQQQDLAGLLTDAVADFLAGKPPADALRFSGPF